MSEESYSKVYCVTNWYVKCPACKSNTEVDTYECGSIPCDHCGETISYDNGNPDNAEQE